MAFPVSAVETRTLGSLKYNNHQENNRGGALIDSDPVCDVIFELKKCLISSKQEKAKLATKEAIKVYIISHRYRHSFPSTYLVSHESLNEFFRQHRHFPESRWMLQYMQGQLKQRLLCLWGSRGCVFT
jgi:hypothetical protein